MISLPQHIALVMDGNGRWATKQHLPRFMGHKAGAKVVRRTVEHALKRGIKALTLFAFSLENQNRPGAEVDFLMSLFFSSLQREAKELHGNNIRLRVIGERDYFSDKLRCLVDEVEAITKNNTSMTLTIAVYYSGRWDIVNAAKKLATQVQHNTLTVNEITTASFQSELCLADLPEPDLLIRTSGEQRISNFLLWQLAYAEIYFTPLCWPDFSEDEFDRALDFYAKRERRFGLTSEQLNSVVGEKQYA